MNDSRLSQNLICYSIICECNLDLIKTKNTAVFTLEIKKNKNWGVVRIPKIPQYKKLVCMLECHNHVLL